MSLLRDTEPSHFVVTGASGFVAMHLLALLLERGHRVRGTLRRMDRQEALRAALTRVVEVGDRLELVRADLESDSGWDEVMAGVDGVFHVASPVPGKLPLKDEYFVGPATSGTLRVLEAARRAKIKRVVITSSVAAISSGHSSRREPFSEQDWSNLDLAPPYEKSKTIAEQTAWKWAEAHPDAPEIATINPSFVLGPSLWAERSPSLEIIQIPIDGKQPGVADLHFGLVDVRDVAEAHYLAMLVPAASGKRFLCNTEVLSFRQIAEILSQHLAPRGIRIATRQLPNWAIRLVGLFSPTIRFIVPRLGLRKELDNSQIRKVLGWEPRSVEQTIKDTADSLLARPS